MYESWNCLYQKTGNNVLNLYKKHWPSVWRSRHKKIKKNKKKKREEEEEEKKEEKKEEFMIIFIASFCINFQVKDHGMTNWEYDIIYYVNFNG
jgi:hypothetical protein